MLCLTRSVQILLFLSNGAMCRRKVFHSQLANLSDLKTSYNAVCISSYFSVLSFVSEYTEKRAKDSQRSRYDNVLWKRNEGVQLGSIQRLLVEAAR